MNIKKRNGDIVPFDKEKIKQAVQLAGGDKELATKVAQRVHYDLLSRVLTYETSVYEVESLVIVELASEGYGDIAESYRAYKDKRAKKRESSSLKMMDGIVSLLNNENEEVASENSNKFAERLVTQRSLVAGQVSKEIYLNTMIPKHAKHAHEEGLLHIHDTDHLAFRMYNCNLIDMDSCLLESTVMNNVLVEPQKDFDTACTVATQIVAGVSANQFGGTTFSTLPLAKVLRKHIETLTKKYSKISDSDLRQSYIDGDISEVLRSGVQTINYQLNTLGASGDQSPFVTIFMYMNEDSEYEYENLLISTEIIRQRRLGVKNEDGHNISLAFPKLILVLEDRFFDGSSKMFDSLIDEASRCVAKRLVPDFISEKHAKDLFEGQVVPPMGK